MPRKNNPVLPEGLTEITVKRPKRPSQKEAVFRYMLEHGSITPMDAVRDLGCMRLAARIAELEALDFPIRHETVEVRNRFGAKCRVTSYSLEEQS